MSLSDHASERLSRKAKRLDSRKRRGTLLHTVLKASLFPSLSSGFSLVPNCSKKSLTSRVFLVSTGNGRHILPQRSTICCSGDSPEVCTRPFAPLRLTYRLQSAT